MTTTGTPDTTPQGPSPGSVAAGARALTWGTPRPTSEDAPRRVWREQVLIRANELIGLATWMGTREQAMTDEVLRQTNADRDNEMRGELETARDAALSTSVWPPHSRARMERAIGSLDAAEAVLLSRSPDDYLLGQLPALRAKVQAHLPPANPERRHIEELADAYLPAVAAGTASLPMTSEHRAAIVEAVRSASWAARREFTRLRSFRTAVAITTAALVVLAVGLALVAASQPQWMPLCFAPQGSNAVVCPTTTAVVATAEGVAPSAGAIAGIIAETAAGADVLVVMLVGLAGAAVTGAAALRRMRGTSTPYAVPMTLLLLKLPTGALTAFLGLILLQGEFLPGLSALDSSGQILAWALVFGAAQQLVTGLVDKKAQSVLDSVGSTPMTADKE